MSNNNENTTVPFHQKFWKLNEALVWLSDQSSSSRPDPYHHTEAATTHLMWSPALHTHPIRPPCLPPFLYAMQANQGPGPAPARIPMAATTGKGGVLFHPWSPLSGEHPFPFHSVHKPNQKTNSTIAGHAHSACSSVGFSQGLSVTTNQHQPGLSAQKSTSEKADYHHYYYDCKGLILLLHVQSYMCVMSLPG